MYGSVMDLERTICWEHSLDALKEWLHKMQPDPDIQHGILYYLHSWKYNTDTDLQITSLSPELLAKMPSAGDVSLKGGSPVNGLQHNRHTTQLSNHSRRVRDGQLLLSRSFGILHGICRNIEMAFFMNLLIGP